MKKALSSIFVFIVILAFYSCNDDSTSPSANNVNNIPTTIGTYWIRETMYLDKNNEFCKKNPVKDSFVLVQKKEHFGKMSNRYYSFYYTGSSYLFWKHYYLYKENSNLYISSEYFNNYYYYTSRLKLPLDVVDKWLLVASDNNTWTQEVQTYKDVPFEFRNGDDMLDALFNGQMIINSQNAGIDTLIIQGQNYITKKYINKVVYTGNITVNQVVTELDLTTNFTFWLAEDIGFLKTRVDAIYKEIPFPALDTIHELFIEGIEQKVTRFSLLPDND